MTYLTGPLNDHRVATANQEPRANILGPIAPTTHSLTLDTFRYLAGPLAVHAVKIVLAQHDAILTGAPIPDPAVIDRHPLCLVSVVHITDLLDYNRGWKFHDDFRLGTGPYRFTFGPVALPHSVGVAEKLVWSVLSSTFFIMYRL